MDITGPVVYRGLTLTGAVGGPGGDNPIEGIRLTRARYSDATVHGYTEKRSLDDGMDASDIFLGARQVVIQGEVFARSKAKLFDLLDLLRLTFTPTDAYREDPDNRGYLPFAFTQPTLYTIYWPTGVVNRVIYLRPEAQPDHTVDFTALGGRATDGYVVPFSTRLQAKDPRFYSPALTEEFISGSAGSGVLYNKGNYPAPLDILVHLSAADSGGGVFDFVGLGSNMQVTIPAGASDRTLRIDGHKKVVTMTVNDVETLRMDLIEFTAGTTWPVVPPTPEGDSPAGFQWTSGVPLAVQSRLFFRDTWA